MVDLEAGVLGIEWIEGEAVRHILPGGGDDEDEIGAEGVESVGAGVQDDIVEEDPLIKYGINHGECIS